MRALLAALLLCHAASVLAQDTGVGSEIYDRSEAQQVLVQTGLVVQQYGIGVSGGDDRSIGQVAVPIFVAVPVHRDVTVSLRAAYASSGGDGFERLAGIADAQLGISYRQTLGAAEMVASLGVGIPLGSSSLTGPELATARLMSRPEFAFEAPTLRQGLRFAPGVTLSVPVDQGVVFGVGASYQVRQSFTPFDDLAQAYEPGNETLLTAGLDAALGQRSVVSVDVALAFFASDHFGDATFSAGNRLSARLDLLAAAGRHDFLFGLGYAHRSDAAVGDLPFAPAVSDVGQLFLGTHLRLPAEVDVVLGARARYLGDFREIGEAVQTPTTAFQLADHQVLFDFSVWPSARISEQVRLISGFTYTLGIGELVDLADVTPLSGFRSQLGVSVRI